MSKDVVIKLTPKQRLAWLLLTNEEDLSVLFGGGKGGGKSLLFCLWVLHWCEHLIDLFEIDKIDSPLPVGFIGRMQGVDFRKTTLETWKKTIPEHYYRIREQDQEIIIHDKVKVYFGGLDDRKRINKFNSAEFAFYGIDQAEETERQDVGVLHGALRLTYNGKVPPYKTFFSANPADCWLKTDFIDELEEGNHFVPALYTDNPHLPESYKATLTKAFKYNPALLAAYLEGDWTSLQSLNALVSSGQLIELKKITRHYKEIRRVVSCDPSLGGDECCIKVLENYKEIYQKILHTRDTLVISGEMVKAGNMFQCPNYCADTTGGLGHAILDQVRSLQQDANLWYLCYSEREDTFDYGVNLKAEMYYSYMKDVMDKYAMYPEDEETRRQVLALKFKIVNSKGMMQIEAKEDFKKRTGTTSPDRAETLIMGHYVLPQTQPIKQKDAWRAPTRSREVHIRARSAMAS